MSEMPTKVFDDSRSKTIEKWNEGRKDAATLGITRLGITPLSVMPLSITTA